MNRIWLWLLAAITALIVAVGCGGGSALGSGSGNLAVFLSDDFTTDYTNVWGTVYKVELIGSDSSSQTVYDDSTGRVIDFNALHDGSGARFAYLGTGGFARKGYSSVRVTVADQMTLIPVGSATGTSYPINAPAAGAGKVAITFNLGSSIEFEQEDNFVVEFNLAGFSLVAGQIVPQLRRGNETGLDDTDRHEPEDIHGTISAVSGTSPDLNIDLTLRGTGKIIKVKTSSSTSVFNNSGAANPVLSVGKKVEVTGKFDTAQMAYLATKIKIEDESGTDEDPHEAKGTAIDINSETFTFRLNVHQAFRFVPPGTTLNVVMGTTTSFRNDAGLAMTKEEFFAAIAKSATVVEIEGTYNAENNTFTLRKGKIEDESGGGGGGGNEVEAKGTVQSKNATDGTATINVTEYEGFSFSGGVLVIAAGNECTFEDGNGDPLTKEAFFNTISNGMLIDGHGRLVEGRIVASRMRIKD